MTQFPNASGSRERSLSAIADVVAYWLKYTTGEHGWQVTADTHVMLNGYAGAPPHWPSVGQLKRWLLVLRNSPEQSGEADETFPSCNVPRCDNPAIQDDLCRKHLEEHRDNGGVS